MNLKIQRSFTPLLSIAFSLLAMTVAARHVDKLECKQTFIKNFGLEGVQSPIAADLPTCPTLDFSCCKRSDGISIYSNWEINGEKQGLQSKLASFSDVYANLLTETQKIADFAETLVSQLKARKMSNCKVLAQRVLHFQIKQIAPKLKEVIHNLNEFFTESYKGFYCSICDATSQRFIMTDAKQLVFSKKFCRNITANTLHYLLYFHVHFVKYVNLLVRFTTHCNYKGEFIDKIIPANHILHIGPIRQKLELCKQGRNEDYWFEVCRFICEEFKLVEFNEFFAPNILKYQEITSVLAELRMRAMTTPEEVKVVHIPSVYGRLLTDVKKEMLGEEDVTEKYEIDLEELEQVKKINLQESVIKSAEGLVPITEFRVVYEDTGIDLLEHGKQSRFSKQSFDVLVMEADEDKAIKVKLSIGGIEESVPFENSIGIVRTVIALISLGSLLITL